MLAPDFSSRSVTVRTSESVSPRSGTVMCADAPPESNTSNGSLREDASRAASPIARDAIRFRCVGSGWSTSKMRSPAAFSDGGGLFPAGMSITPTEGRTPSRSTAARTIGSDAFPAATSTPPRRAAATSSDAGQWRTSASPASTARKTTSRAPLWWIWWLSKVSCVTEGYRVDWASADAPPRVAGSQSTRSEHSMSQFAQPPVA